MSVDAAPERYRRRRRWPILLTILALAIATTVLWFQVVKPPAAAATGCNHPGPAPSSTAKTTRSSGAASASASAGRATQSGSAGTGAPKSTAKSTAASSGGKPASSGAAARTTPVSVTTTLGTFTAPAILAATRPADPSGIDLTVVNASRTRGQASTLTKDLQTAGFDSIADAVNDPLYPAQDLVCAQEIRFGQAGLRQARTVLIIAPCAQLVMDNRVGSGVDLALGENYSYLATSDAAKAQLAAIHDAAAPRPVLEGQTAAARPLASIPPLPAAQCSSSGAPLSSG